FLELPHRIGSFDIGLAPLADLPGNRARSDIKVKEYAASGVPWLASPVGPYVQLGEEQGGRLVPDDLWFEALDRLVSRRREGLRRLDGCDVVHVYRDATDGIRRVLSQLAERGTAITYGDANDFPAVPKQSPFYKQSGGFKGQRIFAETVKAARLARVFTTPSE